MRLSAELLGSSEQRTNPLGEREILLRGLAIPTIEHLGVTRDAFDVMDFTDNRLGRLENFPRLLRLSGLMLAGNVIESIDTNNLHKNLPNLKHMDLSNNQISSLLQVSNLGKACPKLEILSLNGNPVTSKYTKTNEKTTLLMLWNSVLDIDWSVCYIRKNFPINEIYLIQTFFHVLQTDACCVPHFAL